MSITRGNDLTTVSMLKDQFSTVSKNSGKDGGFSVEALRLLAQIERDKRLAKGDQQFNCYVIELFKDDEDVLDFSPIEALTQIDLPDSPVRIQIILKNGGHYTMLDIELSKEGNKCLILDAAGDLRGLVYNMKLKSGKFENFWKSIYMPVVGYGDSPLQADRVSCPLFAYDHVCQSASMDIFGYLESSHIPMDKEIATCSWQDMPPPFVRNAQSMKFLKDYQMNHPESGSAICAEGITFKDYLNQGIRQVNGKDQNRSVDNLLEHYKSLFEAYLAKDNKEIQELPSRSGNYLRDVLGKQPVLTSASTQLSLRDKMIVIAHANQYWEAFSSSDKSSKLIKKFSVASSIEDFKKLAKKHSGGVLSLFARVDNEKVDSFLKAINKIDKKGNYIQSIFDEVTQAKGKLVYDR